MGSAFSRFQTGWKRGPTHVCHNTRVPQAASGLDGSGARLRFTGWLPLSRVAVAAASEIPAVASTSLAAVRASRRRRRTSSSLRSRSAKIAGAPEGEGVVTAPNACGMVRRAGLGREPSTGWRGLTAASHDCVGRWGSGRRVNWT